MVKEGIQQPSKQCNFRNPFFISRKLTDSHLYLFMYLFIYCKLINIWNEIGDETKLFKLEDVTIVSDDTSGFILYYHLEN